MTMFPRFKQLICLISFSLVLTACHRDTKPQISFSSSQSSQQETSSTTQNRPTQVSTQTDSSAMSQASTQSRSTTETTSNTVTESQQQIDSQTQAESQTTNEQNYAETLRLVAADTTAGRATHYTFYDIDGNGTVELLTAGGTSDHLYLAAIYYLKNGVSTYLAQSYVASAGGYRSGFVIYTDGFIEVDEWLSGSGNGTSSLYQLAPDNSGYTVISQHEFNMRESGNPNPVHFSANRVALTIDDFTWTAF